MTAMPLFPRAAVVLLLVLAVARPAANQQNKGEIPLRPIAPLDLRRTLDLYAEGRFDDAVKAVAGAGDDVGRNLRRHWPVTGRAWIDAEPGRRPRRLLVAAALALETENLRAERGDWRVSDDPLCAAACVLDWAQLQLIERGPPDRAERAWYLAAAALAGGVRDWRYLQRWVDPVRGARATPGLIDRALIRFPSDPALRLEQALAAASRFSIIGEAGAFATDGQLNSTVPLVRGRLGLLRVRDEPQVAADLLAALADDPDVGVEARTRLGYLYWTKGNHDASRAELSAAIDRARDPESRYLADFLRGWTRAARGESAAAIGHLEAALDTRPGSQSAAVLLAALELQRGDAVKADALARASFERKPDLDPWRLFLYAHHPRLPGLIAPLRREVAQ
jgi:tetratricopeptide (TPR) repeat protein